MITCYFSSAASMLPSSDELKQPKKWPSALSWQYLKENNKSEVLEKKF